MAQFNEGLFLEMCVIMVHAGVHEKLKSGLWTKCVAAATKPENVMVFVPGVNFTENYSIVATDVTLQIILLIWLINK